MKKLYLYLFIFAVLFNIFTYMFFTKESKFQEKRYDDMSVKMRDSISLLKGSNSSEDYFDLEKNQKAQNYFDSEDPAKFVDYVKLIPFVKDQLLNYNDDAKGNKYTGQDQITDQKFIINKIKILNHRWIIADYSDGEYWGEAMIKYFLNDDGTISYETFQSVLYQK